MSSIQEKIAQELASTGRISSSDMGSFTRPTPDTAASAADTLDEDSTVPVPPEVADHPTEVVGRTAEMSAASKVYTRMEEMVDLNNFQMPEKITITAGEKNRFLESVATGERFELPFSTFGGRLTGSFRCRLNTESDAIIGELNRQVQRGDIVTQIEYGTAWRSSLLRFQLTRWNGTDIAPVAGLLNQTKKVVDGEWTVEDPTWLQESLDMFANTSDAVVSALYRQLLIFERKYWTMIRSADDQNFWLPEDSTLG